MEELWTSSEIGDFLSKNKNKKPYIDPIHEFTDNTHKYLPGGDPSGPNKIDKALMYGGNCAECGDYSKNVKKEKNIGLCKSCRKDENIVDKHTKKCDYCAEPIKDAKDEPDSKFCSEHRLDCGNCGGEIEDLGKKDGWGNEVKENEPYCDDCRKSCADCGEKIEDQEDQPEASHCQNCRKYCLDCDEPINDLGEHDRYSGRYVPDNAEFCKDCRHHCEDCNKIIDDQEEFPDSDKCSSHRKHCENCGGSIDDLNDVSNPDEMDYCNNCRHHCETCGDPIEDQSDYPYNEFCPDHRHYCNSKAWCNDVVEDQSDYPYSELCEDHRGECDECGEEFDRGKSVEAEGSDFCEEHRKPECADPNCDERVRDNESSEYKALEESGAEDKKGVGLTEYCSDHRNRCRICGNNVDNYHELKQNAENETKPTVSIFEAPQIGTHPNDRSSLQYLDTKNPEYFNDKNNKKAPEDWYNLCKNCTDYITSDWIK
jgi:hypothetical protein